MAEASMGALGTAEQPQQPGGERETVAAQKVMVATQWQLMWWRFRKHKLAMVSAVVIIFFYTIVIFADFFAYSDPLRDNADLLLLPPQPGEARRRRRRRSPARQLENPDSTA